MINGDQVMPKRTYHQFLISRLIVIFLCAVVSSQLLASENFPDIKLNAKTLSPEDRKRSEIELANVNASQRNEDRLNLLIQFDGPIKKIWKTRLTQMKVEILEYIPDFTFKISAVRNMISKLRKMPHVIWLGQFKPIYKFSKNIKTDGIQHYRIRINKSANMTKAIEAITNLGTEILRRNNKVIMLRANEEQINFVASLSTVDWIDNFQFHKKHNDVGTGTIMQSVTANANGFDGSSQIAAVADTGIGDGTKSGAHTNIAASRITNIFNWTTGNAARCYRVKKDGPQDVDSGHGTHVSGSVLSAGNTSGIGKGTAPAANLVFQAVEEYLDVYGACTDPTTPDGYYLIGIPLDLRDLYQQAYDVGARVHSNSWGSNAQGEYTLDSSNSDDFIWNNPDMSITFSAGNDGIDASADGIVDADSIGSPATAKNVITVGASENERSTYPCDSNLPYISHDAYQSGETCLSMSTNNLLGTYGDRWGPDFPTPPLSTDPTAGNKEQMAAFSSRGPTDDGRIKPDVVAPGTWILSGFSGLYQEGYSDQLNPQNNNYQWDGWGMPFDGHYKWMGGTSMSNPLVAGAATVIRDFYQKTYQLNASAALVKATLINSAVDLLDENNDGVNDNFFPIPNIHEGWGRVDLGHATDGQSTFIENNSGLSTGDIDNFVYDVSNPGSSFKVTLVWSDYPSSEAAALNLVNDLDLVVTAPDGTSIYYGNNFSNGWSPTGGGQDRVNNVENVFIQFASQGNWQISVEGYNIPNGPQPFALVVDGDLNIDTSPTLSIENPTANQEVSGFVPIVINANDVEDSIGALIVEWNVDSSNWLSTTFNVTNNRYESVWDSTSVIDGPHIINARVIDSALNEKSSMQNINVLNSEIQSIHIGDLDATSILANRNRWNAMVTVTVHDSSENLIQNVTVDGIWSNGANGSSSCITDSNGQCTLAKNNIKPNVSSVSLTITNIQAIGFNYTDTSNHDPDSGSNGSTIMTLKP